MKSSRRRRVPSRSVHLPDDVFAEVLRLLPASRQVCKAWKTVVDEHRHLLRLRRLLPHSVCGLFLNYIDHNRPHFFSPHDYGGPRIDGEFGFVDGDKVDEEEWHWYRILDHCNGLVLRSGDEFTGTTNMYVLNPATQEWKRLPQCGEDDHIRRAFVVFDPAVSPHYYEVFMAPVEREGEEEQSMEEEWPPATWAWHLWASTTETWEERVFVRDGDAAGTIAGLPQPEYGDDITRWRYGAYWRGALYVHCRGEFVSRLSLTNNTYKVIKSPIEFVKRNTDECHTDSYIGKSKHGIYFAAIDNTLRVWILNEYEDTRRTEWVLKHHSVLKPQAWRTNNNDNSRYDGPWTIDICDDDSEDDVSDDDECADDVYYDESDHEETSLQLGIG